MRHDEARELLAHRFARCAARARIFAPLDFGELVHLGDAVLHVELGGEAGMGMVGRVLDRRVLLGTDPELTAKAAKTRAPIDPLTGPKLALGGRVVTMDDAFTVKSDAVVYIDRGSIVAVQDRAMPRARRLRRGCSTGHRRHAVPRPDRAAQSPQLQRAGAMEPRCQSFLRTAASGLTTPTIASSSAVR